MTSASALPSLELCEARRASPARSRRLWALGWVALLAAFAAFLLPSSGLAAEPATASTPKKAAAHHKPHKKPKRHAKKKSGGRALSAAEEAAIAAEKEARKEAGNLFIAQHTESDVSMDAVDWESDPTTGPMGTAVAAPFDWSGKATAASQKRTLEQYVSEVYGVITPADVFWSTTFIPATSPIKDSSCYVSCGFGLRKNPFRRKRAEFHNGLDIAGPKMTPIYATANGVVEVSKSSKGYGNIVWIDHGNGYVTGYAHLAKRAAQAGQYVSRGEVIGYMGRTGKSTGTHLHYIVKVNGVCVDPSASMGSEALLSAIAAKSLAPKPAKLLLGRPAVHTASRSASAAPSANASL